MGVHGVLFLCIAFRTEDNCTFWQKRLETDYCVMVSKSQINFDIKPIRKSH